MDLDHLNKATARGDDCSTALKYMKIEFEILKDLSENALNDFHKANKEKNKAKYKVYCEVMV